MKSTKGQFFLLLTITRILEQKVQLNVARQFLPCTYILSLSIFSKEENLQAIEPSIVLSLQWIILQKQPDFHFHILNFYETIKYTNSLVNATFGSWKKLC